MTGEKGGNNRPVLNSDSARLDELRRAEETVARLRRELGIPLDAPSFGQEGDEVKLLGETGELVRALLATASIGIGVETLDGRTISGNRVLARLLGYTPEELSRKRFLDYTHPDYVQADSELFWELTRGEREYYTIDKAYTRKDGRFVFANPEACRLLGASDDSALIGRDYHDFVCPAYHEIADSAVSRRYAAHSEEDIELRYRRLDGREIDVWVTGRMVRFRGRPAIQVVFRDITEERGIRSALEQSEARLSAIVEAMPSGIFFKNTDRVFAVANRTYATSVETEPRNIIGHRSDDFRPPEVAAQSRAVDEMVLKSRVTRHDDWTVAKADGTRRYYSVIKFPVTTPDGRILGLGAISSDITESKRLESTLREAKDAAEMANRSKSEFLANMSHELRTPLNSIIGFSQLMAEEMFGPLGNPKYREYAGDVLSSGLALLELINDLLDISRIEIGGMPLDERRHSIQDLFRDSARMVAARALAAGLKLEVVAPPGLPDLHADGRRVKQILLNLLSNAIKFTPARGRVTLQAEMGEDGSLALSVTDTGIGIPPEHLGRALSVFGQVQSAQTRNHEGVGLGLPLSKRLAELHGARLDLRSAVGDGTTVRVIFPSARTRQAD